MNLSKKLTVRVDPHALEAAKLYAKERQMSLSLLISNYLAAIEHHARSESEAEAPILERLSGILPAEAEVSDYHDYLDAKYGG